MSIAAAKLNIFFSRVLSALPAEEQFSNGDIILRALIGMAFIMAMIWLAAIIAGKIGGSFHPVGWLADREEPEDDPDEKSAGNSDEIENNDIGGNING